MLHQHEPVQIEHEVCCISCGVVLGNISHELPISADLIVGGEYGYPGLSKLMVGNVLEKSVNWKTQDMRQYRDYQNLLNNLKTLCGKEHLPEYVAYETLKRLLKKKRGLYSYRLQIREMLDVLNDDNRLVFKVRTIKEKYGTPVGL